MTNNHIQLEQLNQKVDNLWNIDNENESTLSWSGEDQRVYDMWHVKTELHGNMYTVPIPWANILFPNDISIAPPTLSVIRIRACVIARSCIRRYQATWGY